MPLDRHALIGKLVDIELERIDDLTLLVSDGINEEMGELHALGGEEDEGIEFYADEAHQLSEVDALFTQLAVIGLYKIVEIRTKSHLAVKASAAELTSAFKFAQVKALFLKYSGVKLASLQHYGAIDELRCLNNAIKHNGVVGKELSAFQGWFLGQRIGDVRPAIARLRSAVAPYLIALGKELA